MKGDGTRRVMKGRGAQLANELDVTWQRRFVGYNLLSSLIYYFTLHLNGTQRFIEHFETELSFQLSVW